MQVLPGTAAVPILSGFSLEELFELGRRLHTRVAAQSYSVGTFDPYQRATIVAIADRIMPGTDTPGAPAAAVPDFIELIVAERYRDAERARFLVAVGLERAHAEGVGAQLCRAESRRSGPILSELEAQSVPAFPDKPPERKPKEPTHQPGEKPAEPDQVPDDLWLLHFRDGCHARARERDHSGRYDLCTATGISALIPTAAA